jgi:hypothetical protein
MSHYRIVFLLSLALLLVAGTARAQSFAPSAERGTELLASLTLKASQKETTKAILATAQKDAIRMRADVEIASIDLRTELEKASPSEKVVGDLIERMSHLEGQLWKSRVVAWIQVQKLLSAKQRRQLQRLRNANGGNIVKTQGEFINPFQNYDPEERRDTENSRLRPPFAKSPSSRPRSAKKPDDKASGEVSISTARAAKIFVDGRRVGRAPLTLRLTEGNHHIRSVFDDGTTPVVRSIKVKAETPSSVHIK